MTRLYDTEDLTLLTKGRMIWVGKKKLRENETIFHPDDLNKNPRLTLKPLVPFTVTVS